MQGSLAATALLMGLAGGPHCAAMCGAACSGVVRKLGPSQTVSMWLFQLGRVAGYALLGGAAAVSLQGLGWLSVHMAVLRPVWSLFHVAAALLGLMLIYQGRQPVWLEASARQVWGRVRGFSGTFSSARASGRLQTAAPFACGALWAFLPCGLLYSALLIAAMSDDFLGGAGTMALFAIASGVSLTAGPWLWLRLRGNGTGEWAVRLAGLALFAASSWALWMALLHNAAPWCLQP